MFFAIFFTSKRSLAKIAFESFRYAALKFQMFVNEIRFISILPAAIFRAQKIGEGTDGVLDRFPFEMVVHWKIFCKIKKEETNFKNEIIIYGPILYNIIAIKKYTHYF